MTAAELLQQARRSLGGATSSAMQEAEERAELLFVMAISRQVARPLEAPAAWEQFQQLLAYLREREQRDDDPAAIRQRDNELTILLRYYESLNDAAHSCRSMEDLDVVWRVKKSVAEQIRSRSRDLCGRVQKRLNRTLADDGDGVISLKEFAVAKQEVDGPVVTLVATCDIAGIANHLDQLLGTATRHERQALEMITILRNKAKQFDQRLHAPQSRIEPSVSAVSTREDSSKSIGAAAQLLSELRALDDALSSADLASWQLIRTQLGGQLDNSQPELASLDRPPVSKSSRRLASNSSEQDIDTAIVELTGTLYRLQQLAYNLWALREIQAADENNVNWDARLAPIDTGLLHPTIAALYSSTYAERISGVVDPSARAATAQHVLATEKVELSAF